MANKSQNYILHLLGCLLFISIPILSSPDLNSNTELMNLAPFRRSLLTFAFLLAFFYANYLYIIPRFYFNRKYLSFALSIIACFFIIAYLPKYLIPFNGGGGGAMPMNDGGMPNMPPPGGGSFGGGFGRRMGGGPFPFLPFFFGGPMLQFLLVFSLSFLLRVNKRLGTIESEKLKTEVSYLRAQINPHFLFNTLNSLYALTLEKSDAAPEAILKLSGMMRYVVTESNREYVALENEINYIKNYISLQKLRIDDNTCLTFETKGSPAGKHISPLLLIPFIENAFKYGLNPEEKAAITIQIDISEKHLSLRAKNNKVNVTIPYDEKSGHGIENTRMRLEYLYPEKHNLSIFDNHDTFEVQLTLELV